jgi:hypothetical protein
MIPRWNNIVDLLDLMEEYLQWKRNLLIFKGTVDDFDALKKY